MFLCRYKQRCDRHERATQPIGKKHDLSYVKKGKIQMKKHENLWRKVVALLLCLVMASAMAACGGTEPDEDLYNAGNGNTASTGTLDDDSVVVIPGGNGEGTGNGYGVRRRNLFP
jgi:hypothetical protein